MSVRASAVAATSLVLFACPAAKENPPACKPCVCAAEVAPAPVAATYGGKTLTVAELDARLADTLDELEKQKHQLRLAALDGFVINELIFTEAAKKNMPPDEFIKSEVDDKVPPPTDAEIKARFDQMSSELARGSTLADFKEAIATHLKAAKEEDRRKAFVDELRKNANVTVTLQAPARPRVVVEAKGPSRGPDNARVTVVEFSDFQCGFCLRAKDTVDEVIQAYAGKVRLVFRQYPQQSHRTAAGEPLTPKAAEAALCANEQGRFWEYHDVLFKNQQRLEVAHLKEHAASLGLDAPKFGACLDGGKYAAAVREDSVAARKAGATGTPFFFINGIPLGGAKPIGDFKKLIDQELSAN
jgi:protein-disulfide isomerase